MNEKPNKGTKTVKAWLGGLSFKTGVIVLAMCVPFYILSFVQLTFPISDAVKGVLWVIFFGLAKTAQYGGLTILGARGVKRLKDYWRSHNKVKTRI